MLSAIRYLYMLAYVVIIIKLAYHNTPNELCSKIWSRTTHMVGRVFLLILLAPAIAASLVCRAARDLFCWVLTKYEELFNKENPE